MTQGQEDEPGPTDAPEALVTVFSLDGREYAIPVGSIVEAVRMAALTPLPQAAPWHAGALNLRGRVIPVIDLRQRLGLTPSDVGLDTRILVIERSGTTAGLLVDAIVGVETPLASAGEPAAGDPFASAILRSGERLIVGLDVDAVLAGALEAGDDA